jgi:hypothetical protein
MPRCFVIQPFDKGPYDKRYKDVQVPAITDAGLEPYRVDEDPSVTVKDSGDEMFTVPTVTNEHLVWVSFFVLTHFD